MPSAADAPAPRLPSLAALKESAIAKEEDKLDQPNSASPRGRAAEMPFTLEELQRALETKDGGGDDGAPQLPLKEEERRECYVHTDPTDPGWPFRFVITQEQADAWFEDARAERINVDNNIYGETAILRNANVNGTPMDIVIKRFKGIMDPDTNKRHQQPSPARARKAVLYETTAHLAVWEELGLHAECRQYLSIPACMDLRDPGGARKKWYSVQTLIQKPGLTAMGLNRFSKKLKGRLRIPALTEARYAIASSYGEMLACIASTGYVHDDMHWENIMVLSNIEDFESGNIDDTFRMEWRVIDWGRASRRLTKTGEEVFPLRGDPLCAGGDITNENMWKLFPMYTIHDTDGDRCAVEGKATQSFFYDVLPQLVDRNDRATKLEKQIVKERHLLEGLERDAKILEGLERDAKILPETSKGFKDNKLQMEQCKLRIKALTEARSHIRRYTGPVTEAVVIHWVREAYAFKLGLDIPNALLRSLYDQLDRDAADGGGDGRMPVITSASIGMQMAWDSADEDDDAPPPRRAGNAAGKRRLPSGWDAVKRVARGMSKDKAKETSFNMQLQRHVNEFEQALENFDPEDEESIKRGLNALRDFYYRLGGVFNCNRGFLMLTHRLTVDTARDNPQIGVVAREIMDSADAARKKVQRFMFDENLMKTSEQRRLAQLWVNMEYCIPELKRRHEEPTDKAMTAFETVKRIVLEMRAERLAVEVARKKAEDPNYDSDATEIDDETADELFCL